NESDVTCRKRVATRSFGELLYSLKSKSKLRKLRGAAFTNQRHQAKAVSLCTGRSWEESLVTEVKQGDKPLSLYDFVEVSLRRRIRCDSSRHDNASPPCASQEPQGMLCKQGIKVDITYAG